MIREYFSCLPPESLTPQEQRARIVELLAKECLCQSTEKRDTAASSVPSIPAVLPSAKGPAPSGERDIARGRIVNETEAICINRIRELAADGFSSQKITEQLNGGGFRPRFAEQWSRTAVWRIVMRLQKPRSSESSQCISKKPSKLDGLKCFLYMVDLQSPD